MDAHLDVDAILTLPLTRTERNHKSRDRHGYHLFFSYFYHQFKQLQEEEKVELLRLEGIWSHAVIDADDASFDSLLTVEVVKCQDIMKLAGMRWRALNEDRKVAWCQRATIQNNRPRTDGRIVVIPPSLTLPSLMENILHSISKDWQAIVSHFRSAIMRKPKNGNSLMSYKFGKERTILYSQLYRKFHINYLLETTIFGSPSFSYLFPYEIVHRTVGECIIHIASLRRLNELLTLGGLSACIHVKSPGMNYGCCGRVELMNRRQQKIVGYVLDETNTNLRVKVDGTNQHNYIEIARPVYDTMNGMYIVDQANFDDDNDNQLLLSQYWPCRFKINKSGSCSIILSRLSFNDEQTDIHTIFN